MSTPGSTVVLKLFSCHVRHHTLFLDLLLHSLKFVELVNDFLVGLVVIAVPPVTLSIEGEVELGLEVFVRSEVRTRVLGADLARPFQAVAFLVGDGATILTSTYKKFK